MIDTFDKKTVRQVLDYLIREESGAKRKTYYGLMTAILIISVVGSISFRYCKKAGFGETEEGKAEKDRDALSPTGNDSQYSLSEIIELAKQNSPVLYTRFNEFNPTFFKRLLVFTPGLLVSEQILCIYIMLNFDTKEIARYTRVSVKSIQARKHRLRKKLNIQSKEDITCWMINF